MRSLYARGVTQARSVAASSFDQAFLTGIEGATEVVLVRHGQQSIPSGPNAPVGQTVDPPLSALGREQAQLVAERLAADPVAAVYASKLQRAFDTGAEIGRHHGLEPVTVADLREIELFREVPADQTAAAALGADYLKDIRTRMARERSWDVFPLSESSAAFTRRVVNAIEGIITSHASERIVIACHGGVINAYAGYVIGSSYDMFFRPAHASIHIVAAVGGYRALHRLNDVHHLETADASFLTH